MGQDTRARFIFIVVLTVLFGYLLAPIPGKPAIPVLKDAKINLGIDLAGGAELTYRVLFDKNHPNKADDTQKATDVIRRRIEQKRLKEPKITPQGEDQIIIQLAGVDQAKLRDYKKLIEQAGKLELFAAGSKEDHEAFHKTGKPPQGFRVWSYSEPPGGDYAYIKNNKILLKDKAVIGGGHVASASHSPRLTSGGGGGFAVDFTLNAEGAKLFDEAAALLFKQEPKGLIAIVLDGEIISAPSVQTDAFHGRGEITGRFDESSARNLAIVLRSGSLPAPIGRLEPQPDGTEKKIAREAEAETFVGPTLGQDSIRRGVWACGLTLAIITIFMLIYYRKGGFIAVITLILNLVFLLGIMSFFNATLTLPGIAGIVLTVGMAVDANILILERIREEQSKGKTASQAFESGHERALKAIIDANVTTIIVASVLYYVGTGPIQGFAVTLAIGILTTLFSVLFCGKTFLRMLISGGLREFKMLRLFSNPNINFISAARICVPLSAILVAGGIFFFLSRGEKNFGPDFRGGSRITFALNEPLDIDTVRKRVASILNEQGLAKYPGADVQTVADPGAESAKETTRTTQSRTCQLRTGFQDFKAIRDDLQKVFERELSHEPFGEMPEEDVNPNPRLFPTGPGGPGWYVYLRDKDFSLKEIEKTIAESCKDLLQRDAETQVPYFLLEEVPGAPAGLKKLKLTLTKEDATARAGDLRRQVREKLQENLETRLSSDPFLAMGNIGPTVAKELKNDSIWAMGISWVLMIVYIAIRFTSWRYGVAAVAALIHDAVIAIAFLALAGALVPKTWGLSFEMNTPTLAAILTVIGYSINDTIVIFDRLRENLILMKKNTFREIINASINQTLSRTILTSLTSWIAAGVLYFFTMTTGGGISEFAFPLLIGIIAGVYSTIYIASPIVLWWYRGQRPATS